MAMAHRGPMDMYTKHYYVADHAVERLRERWAQSARHKHRINDDLRNLVDESVHSAVSAGRSRNMHDRLDNCDFKLVDISLELDYECRAIVRPNATARRDAPKEAIVTIVTAEMAANSLASGRWHDLDNSPMAVLRNIKLPPPAPAPAVAAAPVAVPAPPQVAPEYIAMITWSENEEMHSRVLLDVELSAVLADIMNTPGVSNVRAWREIKLKQRVVVELA